MILRGMSNVEVATKNNYYWYSQGAYLSNISSIACNQVHLFTVVHSHINKIPFYMHVIVEVSQSDFVPRGGLFIGNLNDVRVPLWN